MRQQQNEQTASTLRNLGEEYRRILGSKPKPAHVKVVVEPSWQPPTLDDYYAADLMLVRDWNLSRKDKTALRTVIRCYNQRSKLPAKIRKRFNRLKGGA